MEGRFCGVLRSLGVTLEVVYFFKDLIKGDPLFFYVGSIFLQHLIVIYFSLILFSMILSNNTALILHGCSNLDTWPGVRVLPAAIIVTWGIFDTYHPPTLNIHLNGLGLLKRQYNTGCYGVLYICPEQEVA